MIEFLIITVFLLIGCGCLAKILFLSIQRGQWLDKLLNWQHRLRNWDISGTNSGMIKSKIGGYCELCFSHAIAFIFYWAYLLFMIKKGMWIVSDEDKILMQIFFNVFWYLVFVTIATITNLWFIIILFNPKKNNNGQ